MIRDWVIGSRYRGRVERRDSIARRVRPLRDADQTVSTFDPVAYGGSAVLALLAFLIAAGSPARRAVRVDPLVALREE
jgi:ABC-type lipoprotein release transport system permease subunit